MQVNVTPPMDVTATEHHSMYIDTTTGGSYRYRTLQHMDTTSDGRYSYKTLQHKDTTADRLTTTEHC